MRTHLGYLVTYRHQGADVPQERGKRVYERAAGGGINRVAKRHQSRSRLAFVELWKVFYRALECGGSGRFDLHHKLGTVLILLPQRQSNLWCDISLRLFARKVVNLTFSISTGTLLEELGQPDLQPAHERSGQLDPAAAKQAKRDHRRARQRQPSAPSAPAHGGEIGHSQREPVVPADVAPVRPDRIPRPPRLARRVDLDVQGDVFAEGELHAPYPARLADCG